MIPAEKKGHGQIQIFLNWQKCLAAENKSALKIYTREKDKLILNLKLSNIDMCSIYFRIDVH